MDKSILSQVSLFEQLTPKELSMVANFLIDKEYNRGDKIFKVDTVRDKIVIITDGMAALKANLDGNQTIALFKKYDSLGEMALVSKATTHQYGLEADSQKVKTLEMSVYNWATIIKKNPQTANKIQQNISKILRTRLNHANNKLVALFAAGQIIGGLDDLKTTLSSILQIILKIIPSEKAIFATYSNDIQKVHIYESIGFKNIKDNSSYAIKNDPLLSHITRESETVILEKNNWPKEYQKLPYNCNTLIVSPIKIQKNVIGFIILGNKINGKNFSTNNKLLLESISSQTAPAIYYISAQKINQATQEMKREYIDL